MGKAVTLSNGILYCFLSNTLCFLKAKGLVFYPLSVKLMPCPRLSPPGSMLLPGVLVMNLTEPFMHTYPGAPSKISFL